MSTTFFFPSTDTPTGRARSVRGFTLVELSVATAVSALLITGLFYVTSGHLGFWKIGTAHIRLQHEIQKVLKSLYYDFAAMNTPFFMDANYNLWLDGEGTKNMKLKRVRLVDTDTDLTNGYEKVEFELRRISPLAGKVWVSYHAGPMNESESGGPAGLIRTEGTRKQLISDSVPFAKFTKNPYDKQEVLFESRIEIKGKTPPENLQEDFGLTLRIDHDYIVVE